jgi:two-component sensor histidine kinase
MFHVIKVPMCDSSGEIIGLCGIARDITERKRAEEQTKASLREKEVLLKEIHHRVKNNMQVIISILNLQSKHVKDKRDLEIFKDSQNRIKSMALIHDKLYRSKDLASIDFPGYIKNLASHLFNTYSVSSSAIKLVADVKDISLDINTAIPCGLIINELISNSLKYAFLDGQGGEIRIKLYANKDDTFTLIISDNGIGLPEDLVFRNTKSLALQVVVALVEQLKGTIELDRSEGTAFKIVFKNA